eukprot:CAMPEP_0117649542 /NCGR_PEP_ID=MMETSP0804-20121206/1031_1 /TAXON_ID=1074897 /ORGANISM="Tetraselmis astigmatica, Strain CCMP880" /LENGTH=284 /DNA_ID=CAMNT_0005455293 /DNA_START=433 /DNA_END=1287 /DNA_ORIENTATION=-
MLVCDLDGTLLGDEDALKHFFALWNRRTQLEASAGLGTRSRLVYATGRPHEDYVCLVEEGILQEPDVAITYTGADIRKAGDPDMSRQWGEYVAQRWDPDLVAEVLKTFGFPLLEIGAGRLVFGEHKDDTKATTITADHLQAMKESLAANNAFAEFILSTHHDGTFLDVMPQGINKGSAVSFVREHFKIPFQSTIIAGDSNNDWAMMEKGGHRRVLVGNASPDLVARCQALGDSSAVHLSKERFARGVIDGCRHHGLFAVLPVKEDRLATVTALPSDEQPAPVLV